LQQRGYDGAKRLSGRKRFVVCDTLGLWLEVEVVPASVPERQGAEAAFWRLAGQEVCASLEKVWADGGFQGKQWQEKMQQKFGWNIEIVKRSDDMRGFEVLPKRWIVERSFGWMNWYRRLSKDYEGHTKLSRAWMLWAMTDKMLRTLNPKTPLHPFRYQSI
jgi:transposase